MPSTLNSERLHHGRAVLAVAFAVVAVASITVSDRALTPLYVAVFVLVVGFLTVSSFRTVTDHPLYPVANTVWLTVVFALWSLTTERSPFVAGLTALVALGAAVELYNYWRGTAYLRTDW